jgi:hypothetical protein
MSAPVPSITNLKALAMAAKEAAVAKTAAPKSKSRDVSRDVWLIRTLGERIAEQAEFLAVPAAQRGHGWVKCFECNLPGYDAERHPLYAPETTHWSGSGADPSVGGMPMALLLQGPHREQQNRGTRSLPGGKTSVQVAQEILHEKGADITLDCRFNFGTKTLIVTAIWVPEDWEQFLAKREQRRRHPTPAPNAPMKQPQPAEKPTRDNEEAPAAPEL